MSSHAAGLARSAANAAGERISLSGRLFISVMLVLILEGAVRKWVAESSTVPLILLRDLLATYTIARAVMLGHFRRQRLLAQLMLLWSTVVLGWGLLQLTLGESNFAMLTIGLRFWLLYWWFALAAVAGMNERDYLASVRVLLGSLVLMAPLVILQRYSPPGAFINKSLDADADDIFVVISGVVRTTGTFSFTSGFTIFVSTCAAFALGAFEARKRTGWQRLLGLAVFASLVVCTLVSGARASFLYIGGMLALFLFGNLLFAPMRRKGIALIAGLLAVIAMVGLAFVFQGAVDAIQQRFATASESEDLLTRIVSIFLGEPGVFDRVGWLGAGIGIGSNLAQYVSVGTRTVFVYAESEAGRTLIEGGLAGGLYILLKLSLIMFGLFTAFIRSVQTRAVFPLLVWTALALALLTWPALAQLTANGLLGVLLALGLMSLRYPQLRLFS